MPHSSEGGSADIWKGQQDGNEVCIKAFRAQRAGNLGEMKRVCGSTLLQGGWD